MVKSILILSLFFSLTAQADLFDFNSEESGKERKLPALIKKLKDLEMKDEVAFEDSFNKTIKAIENGVEEEKLYCSGEVADAQGKTLPPGQKPLCMRELKKSYIEATSTIFDIKKKYLGFIHQQQIKKLSEIQHKTKADIEKNF